MSNIIRKIGIIELGGTISSLSEHSTFEFYKGPSCSVSAFIKEFNLESHLYIVIEEFSKKISHEIAIEELLLLANKIQSLLDSELDGIIVTMGTNALEDVAYFIGLVVKSIKPIVFTGAHYPQNGLAFDGKRNLFNAIQIASAKDASKLGVLITFNDYVISARDAIKNNPGLMNHFSAEGRGIVGYVIGGKFHLKSKPLYKHTYQSEFTILGLNSLPSISIIYAHLGMSDFIVNASIAANVAGIISAGFGKGYQSNQITLALTKAIQLGIPVVRCSRSGCGYTNIDKSYDDKYGFIVASGLSPHKASLLLSLALNMTTNVNRIQKIFEDY